jgi:hypothetical protein
MGVVKYEEYPRWLFRGKWVSPTRYIGAVIPGILASALEKVAISEKLSFSDIVRLALWDFIKRHKEAVRGLPIYDLLMEEEVKAE